MDAIFEGRSSDSPYVHRVWRGRVVRDYSPTCPADGHWNLLFTNYHGKVRVSVEGPTTRVIFKNQSEGSEFLVIKFELGVFMPYLPVGNLLNADAVPPEAARNTFWLNGFTWPLPDF